MSGQQFILTFLGIASMIVLLRTPSFAIWRTTLFKYRTESLLLAGLFIGVFYLGGERSVGQGFVDTKRIFRIVLYISIAGYASFKVLSSGKSGWYNNGLIFMTLYGAYGMLSASYSIDPILTIWKSFEVLTHISVAGLIATRINSVEDAHDLSGLYWLALTFIIATLLWGALLYHDEAFRPFLDNTGAIADEGALGSGLRGTFPKLHLNSVTQVGAIISLISVTLFFILRISASKQPILLLLLLGLTVMIFGHSRTSIFAFAISVFVMGYYVKSKRLKLFIVATSLVIGITAIASGVIVEYILRGQTSEQFSSLTGRIDFWGIVVGAIMESPLIGYGYYAGTRVLFGLPGVDNTYLNVLMGGGFILLSIFMVPIFKIMHNLYFSRPSKNGVNDNSVYQSLWAQTFGLFIILFLRSITGPSFDANHFNLILFLLCIINAHTLYRYRYTSMTKTDNTEDNKTEYVKDNILSRKKNSSILVSHDK